MADTLSFLDQAIDETMDHEAALAEEAAERLAAIISHTAATPAENLTRLPPSRNITSQVRVDYSYQDGRLTITGEAGAKSEKIMRSLSRQDAAEFARRFDGALAAGLRDGERVSLADHFRESRNAAQAAYRQATPYNEASKILETFGPVTERDGMLGARTSDYNGRISATLHEGRTQSEQIQGLIKLGEAARTLNGRHGEAMLREGIAQRDRATGARIIDEALHGKPVPTLQDTIDSTSKPDLARAEAVRIKVQGFETFNTIDIEQKTDGRFSYHVNAPGLPEFDNPDRLIDFMRRQPTNYGTQFQPSMDTRVHPDYLAGARNAPQIADPRFQQAQPVQQQQSAHNPSQAQKDLQARQLEEFHARQAARSHGNPPVISATPDLSAYDSGIHDLARVMEDNADTNRYIEKVQSGDFSLTDLKGFEKAVEGHEARIRTALGQYLGQNPDFNAGAFLQNSYDWFEHKDIVDTALLSRLRVARTNNENFDLESERAAFVAEFDTPDKAFGALLSENLAGMPVADLGTGQVTRIAAAPAPVSPLLETTARVDWEPPATAPQIQQRQLAETSPGATYIPRDWYDYKEPDAVHRPDLLDNDSRRALLETLGNVHPDLSDAEKSKTVEAYISLRPDEAALNFRDMQNAEVAGNLARGFETDPALAHLARNYETMNIHEISTALKHVTDIQNGVLGEGGVLGVGVFESRIGPAGELVGKTINVNLIDETGQRRPLHDVMETLLHENRHAHQAWLGKNADRIPDTDPRKSSAEIFKLYSEIRVNYQPGRNDNFAYGADPKEIDANATGRIARHPALLKVLDTHREAAARIPGSERPVNYESWGEYERKGPAEAIPADWDRIADDVTRPPVAQQQQQQQFRHAPTQEQRDLQARQLAEFNARQEARGNGNAPVAPATPDSSAYNADAQRHIENEKTGGAGHHAGRGLGVAMGAYGLYEQLKPDGTFAGDLSNRQTRHYAQAEIAANAGAIAADTTEMVAAGVKTGKNTGDAAANTAKAAETAIKTAEAAAEAGEDIARLSKAGAALSGAGKVARVAAPVSIGLTVAAGGVDAAIAAKTGDGARMARAVGTTGGGILGGIAGGFAAGAAAGAAVGLLGAGVGAVPGAVIGGVVGAGGAIAGGLYGAKLGGDGAEKLGGKAIQKIMDRHLDAAVAGLDPRWKKHLDLNHDGKISTNETRRVLDAYKVTNHGMLDANHDGAVTAKELSDCLNREIFKNGAPPVAGAFEMAARRQDIVRDQQNVSQLSIAQLRERIRLDGALPDTIEVKGRKTDIVEALKDPKLLDKYAGILEAKHMNGEHDYSRQVALLRELQAEQAKLPGQQQAQFAPVSAPSAGA